MLRLLCHTLPYSLLSLLALPRRHVEDRPTEAYKPKEGGAALAKRSVAITALSGGY